MSQTFYYQVGYEIGTDRYEKLVSHSDLDDASDMAEQAAEDHHYNHDGWESRWPLEFVIYDSDKTFTEKFLVEREAIPQFVASKVKE